MKCSRLLIAVADISHYYVEIKCQLHATDGFFIADLIVCST